MRADDRTARYARDRFDFSQQVHLRQPRQHADVIERRAKPAARQRQTDLAREGRFAAGVGYVLGGFGVARLAVYFLERFAQRLPGFGFPLLAGRARPSAHQSRQLRELPDGRFALPFRNAFQLRGFFQPLPRLDVTFEPEISFGDRDKKPPLSRERWFFLRHADQRLGALLADLARFASAIRRALQHNIGLPCFFLLLVGDQIEYERGVDPRISAIAFNALLVAAQIEGQRTFQMLLLPVQLPTPFVNRPGQSQRLLILRIMRVVGFAQDVERVVELFVRRQIGVFICDQRELLREFQTGVGTIGFRLVSRALQNPSRVAEGPLVFESLSQVEHDVEILVLPGDDLLGQFYVIARAADVPADEAVWHRASPQNMAT